ncbi:hypothetical protein M0R45_018231 [Rubus argutus]|uniref:Uncharacterized protein n=1 Tax=Rubus argutus TaxID=59490 RepID=A0AAW1X4J3_RUBAR
MLYLYKKQPKSPANSCSFSHHRKAQLCRAFFNPASSFQKPNQRRDLSSARSSAASPLTEPSPAHNRASAQPPLLAVAAPLFSSVDFCPLPNRGPSKPWTITATTCSSLLEPVIKPSSALPCLCRRVHQNLPLQLSMLCRHRR